MATFSTIKFPKILQAAYFLTGQTRERICEPNSNLFDWNKVRRLPSISDEIITSMYDYRILGAKPEPCKAYQTLTYVANLVKDLSLDEVESYHVAFFKILKWVNAAVETRKRDITRRHALIKKAKEDRQEKITKAEDRAANRV